MAKNEIVIDKEQIANLKSLFSDSFRDFVHTYFEDFEKKDKEYTFYVPQGKMLGELLSEVGIPTNLIKDIKIEEGDLEDAFLKIVRGRS